MRNKKILIFGSNGLVGSSTKKIFSQSKNYEVFGSTRKDTNLFNLEETQKTIENISPDIIINCAAKVGGIVANNTFRTEFILENLKININILESCIKKPEITVINLGSSCIYPLDAPNPIKESSFMDGKLEETNSPYAIAKISAIEIGRSLNKQYGNKVINLMPTNLYGPNDNFDENSSHVIPGLIRRMNSSKIKDEQDFSVWGDGTPLREFLYVDDISAAIKFIIEKDINDDLINIGFGEEISIKELAYKIKEVVKFEGDIVFDTSKPNGNPRKLLDTTLINKYGWAPKYSLDEGLKLTFEWFKKNLG